MINKKIQACSDEQLEKIQVTFHIRIQIYTSNSRDEANQLIFRHLVQAS